MYHLKKAGFYSWQQYFTRNFPFGIFSFPQYPWQLDPDGYYQRDFWKIIYVYSGEGEWIVNGQSYPCSAGSVMLVHPDFRTTCRFKTDKQEICNIVFHPEFIRSELEKLRDDFRFFLIFGKHEPAAVELYIFQNEKKLEPLIRRMEREFILQQDNCAMMLGSMLTMLLVQLYREAGKNYRPSAPEVIVSYVSRLIEERFQQDLSLDRIANDIGVDKSRLCHVYKNMTGNTIMNDLLKRRLDEVRKLLLDSDLSILEVCCRAGFQDLSGFYRRFREAVGCTPLVYRRRLKK